MYENGFCYEFEQLEFRGYFQYWKKAWWGTTGAIIIRWSGTMGIFILKQSFTTFVYFLRWNVGKRTPGFLLYVCVLFSPQCPNKCSLSSVSYYKLDIKLLVIYSLYKHRTFFWLDNAFYIDSSIIYRALCASNFFFFSFSYLLLFFFFSSSFFLPTYFFFFFFFFISSYLIYRL